MRIFDIYTFNIAAKVKFKDTKNYVDTVLKELGYGYKNVAFTYNGFMTKLEQLLNKYPNLSKYYFDYESFQEKLLTSLTPEWTTGKVYADAEDLASIFEIASKCPRGFNIVGTIVLDGIDWYGDGVKEAAFLCRKDEVGKAEYVSDGCLLNSQISFHREYDDGNKYNGVDVVVEATMAGEPRDTTDILQKFLPYFGTPEMTRRVCRNPLEEEWALSEKSKKCAEILQKKIEEFSPREWKDHTVDFIPNLAEKKKIKAAFSGTSFQAGDRTGLLPGMNRVCRTDAGNRQYEILFDRTQSSPDYFYWYVYIKGYNFFLDSGQNTMYASSEQEAGEKLRQIANFCEALIGEMEPILTENFGATPGWYRY